MDVTLIVLILVIIIAAYKVGQFSIIVQMISEAKKLGKELDSVQSEQELIQIEKVNNAYYAYGNDGRFLAQGADFIVMLEIIKNRFPGHAFRVDKTQLNFSEEEIQKLVAGALEVFGEKEKQNG
jgi:hypothetical protein